MPSFPLLKKATALFAISASSAFASLHISEIGALGSADFLDSDGDSSDWVELENRSDIPEPLTGYFLTDDSTNLTKWSFPNISLPPSSTLVIFASGKNRAVSGSELHTNFRLSASGEYLALVAPDGSIADQFSPAFPEQNSDFSYGRSPSGDLGFFDTPTPGVLNGELTYTGFVADTNFSIDRGFYDAPFSVEVTTDTLGATIRYTTDGSKPSETHGTIYTGPITISGTTSLRAIAYRSGFRSSNVDTHTYLFLDQVLQQPTNPAGFPSDWDSIEGSQLSEYEMDPQVIGPIYSSQEVKEGLRSLPTICITTAVDDLFDGDNGIYINAEQRGDDWEREISMEFIDFESGDLQVNTGLRMNGNFSRSKIQPKHNMRVVFREEYGPSRLEYEVFEDSEVNRFNSLIIRGLSGDSWAHARYPHAQYIRDQWFRDAHESMGYPGIEQREVQLYINGLYWGMYHIFERVEDDSMAERFGGEEEDWEVIKDGSNSSVLSIDNGTARWDTMMDIILGEDLSLNAPYLAVQEYLDIDAFIDYMLLNFYGGNDDWAGKNYRAAVQLNPPGQYRFFPHDTERAGYNALRSAGLNKDSTELNNTYRPTHVHHELRANAEYRLRFADRANRYLLNGGALTEECAGGLWNDKAQLIRNPLKAESARWGDFTQDQRGASNINTLTQWQALVDRELTVWFPQRSAIVLNQLSEDDLYPELDSPGFNQHGGNVPAGFNLLFTSSGSDDIYYTTDGSDPRLEGGNINPLASNATTGSISISIIEDSSPGWEYLDDGSDQGSSEIVSGHPNYDSSNWKHPDFAPSSPWETGTARLGYSANENTTIGFGPSGANKFRTTYFRKSFNLTDVSLVSNLLLEVERDDGVIIYLNGTEVVRDGLPAGNVTFQTLANETASGAEETTFYPFTIPSSALIEGENVLAFEVHQASAGSSDLSIDVRLSGTKANAGSTVLINEPTTVKARTYNSATGEWSALTEASFTTGRAPLVGDLTISEVHYHPTAPSQTELDQLGLVTESDFEFLELLNTSSDLLDLSGLTFTDGIDFAFPQSPQILAPGERLLLVNNQAAFELRYSSALPLTIAGEFGSTSGLSNSGERIALSNSETELLALTYDDLAPWPEASDGLGFSQVLIRPFDNPTLSDAANWRSSVLTGGNPGDTDSTSLADFAATNGIADPFADHDSDGIPTIIEYAMGTPYNSASHPSPLALSFQGGVAFIEFPLSPSADDVILTPQSSIDLSTWISSETEFEFLGESRLPDGRALRSYKVETSPDTEKIKCFFRLLASLVGP